MKAIGSICSIRHLCATKILCIFIIWWMHANRFLISLMYAVIPYTVCLVGFVQVRVWVCILYQLEMKQFVECSMACSFLESMPQLLLLLLLSSLLEIEIGCDSKTKTRKKNAKYCPCSMQAIWCVCVCFITNLETPITNSKCLTYPNTTYGHSMHKVIVIYFLHSLFSKYASS